MHYQPPAWASHGRAGQIDASANASVVIIEGVGVNPLRTGLLECLREMGADITLLNQRDEGGEPVADIRAPGGMAL